MSESYTATTKDGLSYNVEIPIPDGYEATHILTKVPATGPDVDLPIRMDQYKQHTRHFVPKTDCYAVQVDGTHFSTFTKDFKKDNTINYPFNQVITEAMICATTKVMKRFNATCAHTHSDEATFYFPANEYGHMNKGNVNKITSQVASMFAVQFYQELVFLKNQMGFSVNCLKAMQDGVIFDARVWMMPNKEEFINYLIWRQQDCYNNCYSTLFDHFIGKKAAHGVSMLDKIEMLSKIDLPCSTSKQLLYGTFVKKMDYNYAGLNPITDKETHSFRSKFVAFTYEMHYDETVLDFIFNGKLEQDAYDYMLQV